MKEKISITLSESTLREIDEIIDNIYIRNRSQAIELLVNNALGDSKVAVILSGGPEEDLKLSDKDYRITAKAGSMTVVESTLKTLKENGFRKVFLIARRNIINAVFSIVQNGSKYGVVLEYVEEKESLGSADSLRLVKGKITSDFLVVYSDILFPHLNVEELWNEHIKKKGFATLLLTASPDPGKKGIVKVEGSKILDFIQKPDKNDIYLGFSSVFVARPEILEYTNNSLENELFPELAKKGLLNGYLSTSGVIKIKSKNDLNKYRNENKR